MKNFDFINFDIEQAVVNFWKLDDKRKLNRENFIEALIFIVKERDIMRGANLIKEKGFSINEIASVVTLFSSEMGAEFGAKSQSDIMSGFASIFMETPNCYDNFMNELRDNKQISFSTEQQNKIFSYSTSLVKKICKKDKVEDINTRNKNKNVNPYELVFGDSFPKEAYINYLTNLEAEKEMFSK